MFVGQFATNKKKENQVRVFGGSKIPPAPENRAARRISIKICKKKKHQKNTKIHLYMFIKTLVYMNSIFLFYFKVLHVCLFFFAVLLFVLFLLVYNCGLSMYSLSRLEQRFFHLYCT